ncbi:MAG: hypothetical protein WC817_00465 [Patescibacteria group bacterium]|jgi:hypothetical protein
MTTPDHEILEVLDRDRHLYPLASIAVQLMVPIHVLEALQAVLSYYRRGEVPYDIATSHALHGLQHYDTDVRTGKLKAIPEEEEAIARLLGELRPHLATDDDKLASELLAHANTRRALVTIH